MWVVRKCFRLLNCVSRTTVFLAFAFFPPLFKAIWISSKVHLYYLWRLIAVEYNCHNFTYARLDLKEHAITWIDRMFFHHLMACHAKVDWWCAMRNRILHQNRNIGDDTAPTRSRSLFRNAEAIQTLFLLIRAVATYLVNSVLLPFTHLQLHYSEIQYALSWTLYQMVFRPPLAFLYLLSTIVNEFSWYLDSLADCRTSRRPKYFPFRREPAACFNIDKTALGDFKSEMKFIPDPIVQYRTQSLRLPRTEVSRKSIESDGKLAKWETRINLLSPNVSPIKIESVDKGDLICLPYHEKFCLEKYFAEHFDATSDLLSNVVRLSNSLNRSERNRKEGII